VNSLLSAKCIKDKKELAMYYNLSIYKAYNYPPKVSKIRNAIL
jgi:hypothetical protein